MQLGAPAVTSPTAILDGLNPQQRAAVTAPFDRHCLVLAGAGCGKTASLTRRIAWCIRHHCPAAAILALTFTRKAAEEMAARLRNLPGWDESCAPPLVTTFHGFGLRVLRERIDGVANAVRLGYGGGAPRLLSGRERLEILARITGPRERQALGAGLLEMDNMLAALAVHPDRLARLGEQATALLRGIERALAAEKRRLNRWEFSDMIRQALDLFRRFEGVRDAYRRRYRYILVDEFQDTNPLQVSLLREVLGGGTRVFAVGDDDQAIYGFRGADVRPTLHFGEYFPGAHVLKLETNYRSTPSVLLAANRIFRDKPAHLRKKLRSGKYGRGRRDRGPRPRKRVFDDQTAMAEWVVATARRLRVDERVGVEEMAVLFRLNETMAWFGERYETLVGSGEGGPRLMTVHGSKGLEFPVVFLCDLEEGVWPNYRLHRSDRVRTWADLVRWLFRRRRIDPEADLAEERRLFYVGVTRAARRLYLLSARRKSVGGRTRRFEPSRFLGLL